MKPLDPVAPAPVGRFEFAHLSDPHLTSLDDVAPWRLRDKRLLGWLSWRRRRRHRHHPGVLAALVADARAEGMTHWAVTGDLTHIGLPHEIEAARLWLASLGTAQDVSVIPGNHDLYVADPADRMHERWSPWMRSDDGTPGFPWLRLRGPVAMIGLDSAWNASWLTATGHLGQAQLRALEDILTRTGTAGYARVVLVHHAPVPGLDRWRKRLVDAAGLEAVLRRTGAELVLHGHGHALRMHRMGAHATATPVIQAPSASATALTGDHRAAWLRCCIERDEHGWAIQVQARAAGATLAHHEFSSTTA